MIASATAADYHAALDAILTDNNVDSAVAIFVPPLGIRAEDVAESIVSAAQAHPAKPVLAVLMGREGLPAGRAELNRAGIPAYVFPESAARALGAMRRLREWRARPNLTPKPLKVNRDRAGRMFAQARSAGRLKLSELEVLGVLNAYGIPTAPARLAHDPEEAARAAAEIGFPVVLKIVSPDIIHKTEVGGVRIDLATAVEVKSACAEMLNGVARAAPHATIEGILVQRMVPGGRETIVGVSRDRAFGALVMFGLGGIYVEALRDVIFRIAPIGPLETHDMLKGIRSVAILEGVRGAAPVDFAALGDVLQRVAQLAMDFEDIAEMDINPLLAFPDGATAVDARILLQASTAATSV